MKLMFYFLLALTAIFAATANAGGPVLDADGDIIFNGSYYVLPLVWGPAGGGLTLTSGDYKKCPLYIGQDSSEVNMGIPIKFSNWKSKVGFVPESESLSIEMDTKATICGQSTYWWVAAPDMPKMLFFFIMSGPKPKPGEDSSKSFFQIKKTKYFHNGYTIAFCPNDNDCIDVGIFVDEYGVWRLALSPTPFPVMFVKAIGTETSDFAQDDVYYLREIKDYNIKKIRVLTYY
uniref:Uncharacterized protein n=1 Tax=Brassica campestris TaxID=3711 RepID=A0A3P6BM58_BRACM|nr:unnamed protein product [Brassica rapa]